MKLSSKLEGEIMYLTKQKKLMMAYFTTNANESISASTIINELRISKTTTYRLLESLVKEKYLKQTYSLTKAENEYQLIKPECHQHLHLVCARCGKIIHLSCEDEKEFVEHIAKEHDFIVNLDTTTLQGICTECNKRTAKC